MAPKETATASERDEPMAVTAKEFCRRLSISHATLYNLMNRGEVKTFTIGKRRLIPMSEVLRLLSEAR